MDKLQQVKAKLEEMKAKYNFERENEDNPNHSDDFGMYYSGFFTCLKEISFFLDALEVKEEVLEKHLKEDIEDVFFDLDGVAVKGAISYLTVEDIKDIAKHFFELGLSVGNSITAADRGTAEEIIMSLKQIENDYRIDHTKEIEWVRNQVKKGE